MDRRPFIGVSTYLVDASWGDWQDRRAALVPERYTAYVQDSGGIAVLLPPDAPERAPDVLARLDALVIAGGPDLDPAFYGSAPHPRTEVDSPERDVWETALLRGALAAGIPLLGICRGMQVLNVVCGGTLVQHLPDVVAADVHGGTPGKYGTHPVRPVPGTLLGGLLPESELDVPTFHHQAVDRLGAGLRVSAHAPDGTVEAVEGPGFTLGVQWHPEQGDDLRVMQALVRAATAAQLDAVALG
ncbi:gamma-glutamyl-gamma-aminobutyrate hydrolase family protein [Streptomyces kaniharaensis]|uniref:Gamma-glutamyl-gamma-aminobutyrate hydrolase family protein n=1 Tax=Streptomyces kaniharaensis TaxID=212423 RepID=A0A6N7KMV5_9ACTN|nr:gamma-glutamyl-gamma-aminobutyrate hydrolase family protein [Streptomyces kaniharaensis]MQS11484.1 gamma-glutamyl-gamma-aminobutyrate hydrolase family protein [Streptomyces kaniharaensis]